MIPITHIPINKSKIYNHSFKCINSINIKMSEYKFIYKNNSKEKHKASVIRYLSLLKSILKHDFLIKQRK